MVGDLETGIGISWLWMLPASHPFYGAAVWHDYQYDHPTLPWRQMEKVFLLMMLRAARRFKGRKRKKYIAEAYMFSAIARMYGFFKYPNK